CCVIAAVIPIWTVVAAPELERLGALALAKPAPALVARSTTAGVERAVVVARGAPVTALRMDPPGLQVHAVGPGETRLSIAAVYAITPQTLAFNNGIKDTSELRPGQSLVIPPIDAAIHVVSDGETVAGIAASFGADPDIVRTVNSVAFEPADVTAGRVLLIPVPEGRYPGFRLMVSEAPRVFAPRIRWPTDGIVTQLFSQIHTGIDIAAPYGSPVVASDSGTVTEVGWRGPGGLSVCVLLDWGLEICDYHLSGPNVGDGGTRETIRHRSGSAEHRRLPDEKVAESDKANRNRNDRHNSRRLTVSRPNDECAYEQRDPTSHCGPEHHEVNDEPARARHEIEVGRDEAGGATHHRKLPARSH